MRILLKKQSEPDTHRRKCPIIIGEKLRQSGKFSFLLF